MRERIRRLRSRRTGMLAGIVLISALLVPLTQRDAGAQTAPQARGTVAPDEVTRRLRLPPKSELSAKHRAEVEHFEQQLAAARNRPAPAQRRNPPQAAANRAPTWSPYQHTSAGAGTIVESSQAPLPGNLYAIMNRWYEAKGRGEVVAYAGADQRNPTQGLVVVVVTSPESARPTPQVYRTPRQAGSVRIVSASGERLQLVAANGATFTFDVASRAFVDR